MFSLRHHPLEQELDNLLRNFFTKIVRLSGDFRSTRNPKIRSALRFGSQVTSEKWKSKEFVRLSGDFRRMEKTKFRSVGF
ncbi:unnamed protein product [Rhizophagus irregularis]|nr:unnamed protein product [Rhizophagus irregularis]